MRQFYFQVSKVLDTSLLGIFTGIISGIAINIATGQILIRPFLFSIFYFAISVVFLIWLIQIRQNIDDELSLRSDIESKSSEKWEAAADYNNKKRVRSFLVSITFVIVSFTLGINSITIGNNKIKKSEFIVQSNERLQSEAQTKNLNEIKQGLSDINKQIQVLMDSISYYKRSRRK